MGVFNNVVNGKYKVSQEIRNAAFPSDGTYATAEAKKAYREEAYHLEQEVFRADLENEFGTQNYPKRDALWTKAWKDAHSGGLQEVYFQYEELVNIINFI
jgi:hypothetical protein